MPFSFGSIGKGVVLDVVGYLGAYPAKKNVNAFFLSPPMVFFSFCYPFAEKGYFIIVRFQ